MQVVSYPLAPTPQALSALSLQGMSGLPLPLGANGGGMMPGGRGASVAAAPLIQQQFQPPVLSSICVKGEPAAAAPPSSILLGSGLLLRFARSVSDFLILTSRLR